VERFEKLARQTSSAIKHRDRSMIKGISSQMKRGDHRPESGLNKRGVKQIRKMAAKKNGGA
jgi:hypothetical protein